MPDRICAIEGCGRKAKCRGWCDTHYARWHRGTPMDAPITRQKRERGPCRVDGCESPESATRLCQHHYNRNRRYGDPLLGPPRAVKFNSTEERFWSMVDKSSDCWVWTGATFWDGYGTFIIKKRQYRAHRLAYEWTNGEIPEGLLVDHRCHNRRCVNPDHLRLANRSQNNQNRAGAQSNSRSGIRGVQQLPNGRWQARVRHNRQTIHVGVFDTAKQAESAAIAKRNELFTHNDLDRKRA